MGRGRIIIFHLKVYNIDELPIGYIQPRYEREFLPENAENNEELGGSY
jgi:hypothetical protein